MIEDLEQQKKSPLSLNDPLFPQDRFTWIYEPGIHVGFTGTKVVFMVRIR